MGESEESESNGNGFSCRSFFFILRSIYIFSVFFFFCFVHFFPLPTGIMPAPSSSSSCCLVRQATVILFELLRMCSSSYPLCVVLSPVLQVSGHLQHLGIIFLSFVFFSCTLTNSLFSFDCFGGATAAIFSVLVCPRYKCLFLFITYIVLVAALHFRSSSITLFRTPATCCCSLFCFVLFVFPFFCVFSFFFMVWLVLLCSRTRSGSISLAFP